MRKNILKAAFAAAMVAVAGYGVYANQQSKEEMSDVMLANVEALAWIEGSSLYRIHPCPSSSGTECRTSSETYRPECWSLTYCR